MAEYYCSEHQTPFFKRGRMRGFAHPIGDTGKWCNMPDDQEPEEEAPEPAPVEEPPLVAEAKKIGAEVVSVSVIPKDATRISIAKAVAFKGCIDLVCGGVIDRKEITTYTEQYTKLLLDI